MEFIRNIIIKSTFGKERGPNENEKFWIILGILLVLTLLYLYSSIKEEKTMEIKDQSSVKRWIENIATKFLPLVSSP